MNDLWLRVCARFNRSSADTLQNTFAKKKKQLFVFPKRKSFHLIDPRLRCFIVPNRHSCALSRHQTHAMVEKKKSRRRKKENLMASNFNSKFNLSKQQQQHLHVTVRRKRWFITISDNPLFPPFLPYFPERERTTAMFWGQTAGWGKSWSFTAQRVGRQKKDQWSQSHIISKAIFHTYGNLRESFWLCCCTSSGSPAAPSSAVQPTRRKKNNDFTSSASKSAFQKQAIKNIHVFLWCAIMLLIPHQQYAQQTHAWWRIRSISECWWFPCH